MRSFLVLYAALSMIVVPSVHALAVEPGDEAPRFELAALDGGYTESSNLFGSRNLTFLVFWESQCRHCVESLAQAGRFHREYGGADIAVAGVNTDSGGPLHVRSVVEGAGVDFPQLLDPDGGTAERFGVPFASLAVFLVDRRGLVAAKRIDPEGDLFAVMEEMLSTPAPEAPSAAREKRAAGTDEGPGLAATGNLFVPFFTTKPHGSGIGLALGRQIAEAHGGSLILENREDRSGCRARVLLPLANGSARRADR